MEKNGINRRGILSFLLKSKNPAWKGKKVVLNKPHILNIRGSVNNFASFFIFTHAKVSAAFILIFDFSIILVYLKLWYSLVLPNCLSIVSFL